MARDRGRGRRRGAGGKGEDAAPQDQRLDPEEVLGEDTDEETGLAGSGRHTSGSLPGSVGGTTGVGGENAGIRSPGAGVPSFPGISPEEAERLKKRPER